jgi:hypothetical protein
MSTRLREISHSCLSRFLERLNCIEHIKQKETTYYYHFLRASSMGFQMFKGGLCLIIHSILPNYFQETGSRIIKNLHKDL